jgi:hypothetical protein
MLLLLAVACLAGSTAWAQTAPVATPIPTAGAASMVRVVGANQPQVIVTPGTNYPAPTMSQTFAPSQMVTLAPGETVVGEACDGMCPASPKDDRVHYSCPDAMEFLPGMCGEGCAPPACEWIGGGGWYFTVDALALKRDQANNVAFATWDDDGNVALETRQRDFPFRYGAQFTAGRTLSPWFRVEGTYFGLANWNELVAVRDNSINAFGEPGDLFSRLSNFGNPPTVGLDFNDLASINYSSALDNVELNLRRRLDTISSMEMSVFGGARYISVRERMEYFTSSALPLALGATNSVNTRTTNDLFGLQIGATLNAPLDDDFWLGLTTKGAICQNIANQDTVYATNVGGVADSFAGGARKNASTWVGDVQLTFNYRCCEWLTCRVGYQATWMDGLALASDNIPASADILRFGPATIEANGRVVYHGPHAGFMLVW